MDKFVIRGGNPLLGTIRVSGAKNSALPCMAAAILTEDEVTLETFPGARHRDRAPLAGFHGRRSRAWLRARTASHHHLLPYPLRPGSQVRNRKDHAGQFPGARPAHCSGRHGARGYAGGCAIGGRPIDLHIKAGKDGRHHHQEHGYLEARADRLRGAHLVFDKITVTARKTADGRRAGRGRNPDGELRARTRDHRPGALLTAMGAKIEGAGQSTIRVQGVTRLHGARHRINPDRIEAGTFLLRAPSPAAI